MKPANREDVEQLEQIPNIGPAVAGVLQAIGISSPRQLRGKDPFAMYRRLCGITGLRYDLCVLDVFIAATRFMAGHPARPWWKYTPERKRRLAGSPTLAGAAVNPPGTSR